MGYLQHPDRSGSYFQDIENRPEPEAGLPPEGQQDRGTYPSRRNGLHGGKHHTLQIKAAKHTSRLDQYRTDHEHTENSNHFFKKR